MDNNINNNQLDTATTNLPNNNNFQTLERPVPPREPGMEANVPEPKLGEVMPGVMERPVPPREPGMEANVPEPKLGEGMPGAMERPVPPREPGMEANVPEPKLGEVMPGAMERPVPPKEPEMEVKSPEPKLGEVMPGAMERPVPQMDSGTEEKAPEEKANEVKPNPQINIANQKNMFEVKIDESVLSGSLLDTQIDKINNQENVYECGRVIKVTNFIVEVAGLDNLSFFEKVKIGDSAIGYVNGILENSVTVAILKNSKMIKIDDKVYSTGETLNTFFSNQFVGRIIDMFGNDLYTENKFENMTKINIETKPIPIMARGTVNRPLQTGISGIDLIYPIGKGQRQLIVGDKKTGKTQLCLDVIANQQNKQVLCIYVAIGKTKKEVKSIYNELQTRGALSYTMIISAFNDDKPPIIYLTPYAALSIAEVFMKSKYDVLVVIDDLKRHADAYREISLVSGKTPGRDAYPADIFYTHSRMLEKGCQLENGGSITILPIVETKGEDITDYITTNIISITDGQLYLSSKLFNKGQKPAIDYGLSVSRLGGAVQEPDMKKLGASVRLKLLNYLETQDVYQFANLDEMGGNLKNKIIEGKKLMELLNQNKFSPKTKDEMINEFKSVIGATNES